MQQTRMVINEGLSDFRKISKRGSTLVIILMLSLLSIKGYADSGPGKVTGKVTDDKGVTLPGVTVLLKGTDKGAVTDFDGNYSLQVIDTDTDVLVFSFLGMATVEEAIKGRSVVNVMMKYDAQDLDEIIVVGYGTQKKSDITGAVVSLSKERLTQIPFSNFAQAIQGMMPGVSVVNGSNGAEQNGANIMVRGRNSISASNSPLIVLDGIPFSGNYSDISPSSIASIEVLKDASSAAIYGSRGSNGVILITTKKGKNGKAVFSYDASSSVQTVANLPNMMNGNEFYDFKTLRDAGGFTTSEEAVYAAGKGVNWVDLATRKGLTKQHTMSLSGGSDQTKYFISGAILDVKGIAVNDDYSRVTSRINLETKVNKWLTIGTNTQFTFSDRSGLASSFENAFLMNPLTTAYEANGDLTVYPWAEDNFFVNPLQNTLAAQNDKSFSLFTNNYFEIEIPSVKGLKYRFNSGYELTTRNMGTYHGRNTGTGLGVGGKAVVLGNKATSIVLENILTYNKTIDKHAFAFTGLYSFQEEEAESHTLRSQGFEQDALTWYQAALGSGIVPSSYYNKETLISLMGRVNYSYDSKYLVTLTARKDGFSGFGSNNKWGLFPSVALGWNMHEESFMNDVKFVNKLKLRLSYGQSGNQGVGAYETIAKVSPSTFILDGDGDQFNITSSYVNGATTLPGFFPSSLGQADLGWETTTSFNFGADFGLLNNKVQGSLDVFTSNTTDLLLARSISSVHGIATVIQNIGEVQNTGIELALTTYNVSTDNFSWNTSGSISYTKNEIVDLYGDGNDDILNKWFLGQPISSNYGYVFNGVWQVGDDYTNAPFDDDLETATVAGFAKIKDTGNDGISADDKEIQGHTDPNIIWGLTNTLKYKDFTLNVFFQGVHGGTRANVLQRDDVWGGVRRNTMVKNWWTAANATNDHWSAVEGANDNFGGVDIYESTSFVRLKDMSLSYDLPESTLAGLGVDRLRVSLTGRNLMTITDWTGMDPELTSQTSIPLQKEYSLGLVLGF